MLKLLKVTDLIFIGLVALNTFLNIESTAEKLFTDDLLQRGLATYSKPEPHDIKDITYYTNCTMKAGKEQRMCGGGSTIKKVLLVCSWQHGPYHGIVGAWPASFGILIRVRFFCPRHYAYDDWRYVLATDQFNGGTVSLVLFLAGAGLTLATFGIAIHSLIEEENPPPGTVWAMVMFVILNIKGLLFSSSLVKVKDASVFDSFTEPIPITKVPGGSGSVHEITTTLSLSAFLQLMIIDMKMGKIRELTEEKQAARLEELVRQLVVGQET